jgi:hypothetical protein
MIKAEEAFSFDSDQNIAFEAASLPAAQSSQTCGGSDALQ